MTNIRRYYTSGSVVFITAVCYQRNTYLKSAADKQLLLDILKEVKNTQPYQMIAYVILDDHFHLMLKPVDNQSFSKIMQSAKLMFTHRYKKLHGLEGNVQIWQRRFWDHVIKDEQDYIHHLDYIHYNPARHGLVKSTQEYTYSSFKEYVDRGNYELNWGTSVVPEYLHAMEYE